MESVEAVAAKRPGMLRRLYDWVLHWAESPYAVPALFALAFAESSFFPIPPDVLLLAMALGSPKRAMYYALVCTLGSVVGGLAGYGIGKFLFLELAEPILRFYDAMPLFDKVKEMYQQNTVLFLGTAAFTPVPYKVFTIAGGACDVNLLTFTIVSFVGRGARFFMVAGLIWKFGPPIKTFIDKYFNLLTVALLVLILVGFAAIKYLH